VRCWGRRLVPAFAASHSRSLHGGSDGARAIAPGRRTAIPSSTESSRSAL
jgi:hypothetical protein